MTPILFLAAALAAWIVLALAIVAGLDRARIQHMQRRHAVRFPDDGRRLFSTYGEFLDD